MSVYRLEIKRQEIEEEMRHTREKLNRGYDGNLQKILLDRLENAQREYAGVLEEMKTAGGQIPLFKE